MMPLVMSWALVLDSFYSLFLQLNYFNKNMIQYWILLVK